MKQPIARIGWGTAVALALLGVTAVVLRVVHAVDAMRIARWFDPTFPVSTIAWIEGRYDRHPFLTMIHLLPGAAIFLLGPLQFLPSVRASHPHVHRWSGRAFVAAGVVTGVSALAVTFVFPVFGAFHAPISMTLFGSFFLFALIKAFVHIRRREVARHREWMIRAFATALGVSTFRVLALAFVLAGVSFVDTWNTVIWLAFVVNLGVAEWWINVTRPAPRRGGDAAGRDPAALAGLSTET